MDSSSVLFLFGAQPKWITVLWAVVCVAVISRVLQFRHKLQAANNLPGYRPVFYPLGPPGAFFSSTRWYNGIDLHWARRFQMYRSGENVSVVPWFGGPPAIYTSNLDVTRQVASGGHKSDFIKPQEASRILLGWGMNLVAADGEVWRRHRRIMGPAFNNDLYKLVWNKTQKIYYEMLAADQWANKHEVSVPAIQRITFKLALSVIAMCGFGISFDWKEPSRSENGTMSIQEAFRIISDTGTFAVFAPKWVKRLPLKYIRDSTMAHEQLSQFMKDEVVRRRAQIANGEIDFEADNLETRTIFNLLVKASEEEGGKYSLDDEELIGNVFIMLFAGHETTAQTLATTLGFLAIHDDIQDEVYEQIKSVLSDHTDPTFDDYPKLDKVLAVFYEATRMIPPGHLMIREATKDTVIQVPRPMGDEGTISMPIPKGFRIIVDMVGVQYNPRYFDEPEKFKPSRWHGISNESEAFTAFSVGPRACLGRKVATTEAVCFLTLLLREWSVKPILREGESKQAWKDRVLDGVMMITLGVKDVPVTFVRRH
ncbi:cytochrome P450 [Guyanagaster necrorhizus]|uniref:Cytochrome P450 n=1 Tax=Guyanagaster necrorhizus TaxID=856835 RepID=A0A9P8AMV1_9AGAR|nr:cytochrome P450 [Guyanagaster necrorhizus MCA 3950]KAG7441096.1 cytochrome P450 [Guyanagaster necrorhizus MCA 3950]